MKKYCFSLLFLCALHLQAQHKIAFDSSLTGAFEKAGKANKLVFVDCQTSFCGACRRVEQELFTLDSVADYFNEHFVSVSLNMVSDEGLEAGKKYQIKALPTFLIMDGEGKELYRFTGFWPANEYMAQVRSGVNPQSTMSGVIAAYKAGDCSKPVLQEYTRYSMHAHDDSAAKAAGLKYLKLLSDEEKLLPENWFLFNNEEGSRIFGFYSEQFNYLADHWRGFAKLNGKEKVEDRLRYNYTTIISGTMTGSPLGEHHTISQKEFDRYRQQIKGSDLSDKEQLAAMMEIAQAMAGKDTMQVSKLMVRYVPIVTAAQQGSMVSCFQYMLRKNKDYKSLPYFRQVVEAVIAGNKDEVLVKEMKKYQQQPYTVTGQLGKDRQGTVWVIGYAGHVRDSALVKDGLFMIKGNAACPGTAELILNYDSKSIVQNPDRQTFYLEAGAYTVKSDSGFRTAIITGGRAQTEYTSLAALKQPINAQLEGIKEMVKEKEYKAGGSDSGMQHLNEMVNPLLQKSNAIDSAFIADHPDSYLAFDLWRTNIWQITTLHGAIAPSVLEPAFLHFSERIRHLEEGTKLATYIAKAKRLDIGQPADGITLKDTLGQEVCLSSLKGKYVLVCFWHNWKEQERAAAQIQRTSMARVNRLFRDKGLYILAASAENNPDYCIDEGQCLLIGPDGKILAPRLILNNELPGAIGMFLSPAARTGEADVYVGGDMMKYPQVEWIKGQPVTAFEKDRIYIVELWATWCVPCVAAMPHLNELSKKFAGKITFIGQDVWEEDKEKVEKFVEARGNGLTFRIAFAGGTGSDFDKKWIQPAGVTGIPQTFIIQNNKLVWQTRPNSLNEAVLQSLVDKKFTIAAAEALAEKN